MYKKILIFLIVLGGFFFLKSAKVSAAPIFDVPSYDVYIDISKDSSFSVSETANLIVNGDFHGLRRDIPLENTDSRCSSNSIYTCGGFELLLPKSIIKDENEKDTGSTSYSVITDAATAEDNFRFQWELYQDGKYMTDKELTWEINYDIYGGIRNVSRSQKRQIFYWNLLPENKPGFVESSEITVKFPSSVDFSESNLEIFTDYTVGQYDYRYNSKKNELTFNLSNISQYGNFTIAYTFEKDEIDEPASISYNFISPKIANEITIDGYSIYPSLGLNETIDYFPTGKHELKFSHIGYKSQVEKLNLDPGEHKSIEVELKPTVFMSFLLMLNWFCVGIGICLIPFSIYLVYRRYQAKGKDIDSKKTIVPEFNPPSKIKPYLLGALKDETVDKRDITSSIIDLAYRGHLKIKEIEKGKNYKLTFINNDGVDAIEKALLDALFKSDKHEVETKNLTYAFVQDMNKIESDIYNELVSKKYFDSNPKSTRQKNFGLGFGLVILGFAVTILFSIFTSIILGQITIFSIGLALAMGGGALIGVAKYMPQKTAHGSEIFNKVLGFKMYMETAEKYRVQNLEPEYFEKFLSYAVVFGIEKKWAEKFKDIYKATPEWYEGSGSVTDAIFISSFANSFTTATTQKITTLSHSSGARGSGWSGGGGSFGGFSGGGGGGGSSGGW